MAMAATDKAEAHTALHSPIPASRKTAKSGCGQRRICNVIGEAPPASLRLPLHPAPPDTNASPQHAHPLCDARKQSESLLRQSGQVESDPSCPAPLPDAPSPVSAPLAEAALRCSPPSRPSAATLADSCSE
mmetsp:Transcript_27260/g.48566  ORF Transcript_27260/g.48566 Transcript_27260/m.48566 type:complete len:131 (-) Transcript_27260:777-1169(-)